MGTFNSGSKGGALTLIPVVKSGNGAGKTQSDGSRKPSTNPPRRAAGEDYEQRRNVRHVGAGEVRRKMHRNGASFLFFFLKKGLTNHALRGNI